MAVFSLFRLCCAALFLLQVVTCTVYNFQSEGAKPDDTSTPTAVHNGAVFNSTLAKLQPGDLFVVPSGTFSVMGGIQASNLVDVTISIDGTLLVSDDLKAWPRSGNGDKARVLEVFHFFNVTRFTLTSSNNNTGLNGADAGSNGVGLIDGQGGKWWGIPLIGYAVRQENRPRLLNIQGGTDVLVENIFFKDSPYWTTFLNSMDGLEVRNCKIEAWRVSKTEHTLIDLTAFNTDGFDVTGTNIWIHHSTVWNQDDCFCIKDGTSNVLVENVNASGLGLTIGSISSTVRNITFRNAYMSNTVKGIYMKFRGSGSVSDVLYENIVMDSPSQYPIWLGPAQQSDDAAAPCAAHPCSLCWPDLPGAKCDAPANAFYNNVTFRNVVVRSPKGNPGVILANSSSPMTDVVFDNVVIEHPSTKKEPWGTNYLCEGVASGIATGSTSPVPPCFKSNVTAAAAAPPEEAAGHGADVTVGALS